MQYYEEYIKNGEDANEAAQILSKEAATQGKLDIIQMLTQNKTLTINYLFPFEVACHQGQIEIVKYLVEENLISATAPEGKVVPLDEGFFHACWGAQCKVVEYLLNQSPNIEAGWSVACQEGHLEIVKLLTTKSDIYKEGLQSVLAAIIYNKLDILNYYLYDINFCPPEGFDKRLEERLNDKFSLMGSKSHIGVEKFQFMVSKRDLFFKLQDSFENSKKTHKINKI